MTRPDRLLGIDDALLTKSSSSPLLQLRDGLLGRIVTRIDDEMNVVCANGKGMNVPLPKRSAPG
ncbi:MAG: hypothetical protein ACFHWZ_04370 [Phycisphaerales bacterium]